MSHTAALHQKRNNRSNDSRRAAGNAPAKRAAAVAAARRAADAAFTGLQQLEPRQLMSFSAHVDFKPIGSTSAPGYVGDTGAVYANRGNGYTYGWNVSTAGQ